MFCSKVTHFIISLRLFGSGSSRDSSFNKSPSAALRSLLFNPTCGETVVVSEHEMH